MMTTANDLGCGREPSDTTVVVGTFFQPHQEEGRYISSKGHSTISDPSAFQVQAHITHMVSNNWTTHSIFVFGRSQASWPVRSGFTVFFFSCTQRAMKIMEFMKRDVLNATIGP